MILDLLKNIISMADNPGELGKYITAKIREVVVCKFVILFFHNNNYQEISHELLGISPEQKKNDINVKVWHEIAEASHEFHGPTLFQHKKNGTRIEQLLFQLGGKDSIIIPLEFTNQRVGLLAVIDIFDTHNLQSIIDSLDAISGVLAIELRNSSVMQNLEILVATRTKQLSDSEKRFRTIIEQATDAMYLSDLEGNIIDTNQQACKSLGYTREELLKLKFTDLDARFDSTEKMQGLLKKMVPNKNFTFESVHRHKTGNTFPVEISMSLIDLDGSNVVIGFVRDISERKESEQKIIRMGQHYQALIEKAPDGIVLISAEGSFKFVSPAARKMFGYTNNEEITGNPSEYTHPEDLPEVLAVLQELIHDPSQIPTITYRFIDRSGKWRWIESTFSNLLADPSVEAIVINFRDITDRKLTEEEISKLNEELEQKVIERTNELEKRSRELLDNEAALLNLVEDLNLKSDELQRSKSQLEIANRELEAFSYSVSHDLRAPLRAISGFVSILLEDYEQVLDAEGKRICNIVYSNAIKMGQLIDDLLSFSRLIRSELHHSRIDMEGLVKSVISDFETTHRLTQENIIIQKLLKAVGDSNLIKQVWINLISNAIKYSSKNENAQITIGSYSNQNELVYYVKDNGVGFDMEYVHKLFGVFQRLHNMNEFEGTGVGLAIVQRIINRHQGRVWAEGEVGKGASFYFTLPGNSH